jgi:hypothetical protein
VDTEVRDLVARRLQSPVKIEVVRFFVNAFSPLSTAAGISMWLGLSEKQLSPVLVELVRDGFLARSGDGEAAVLRLCHDVRDSEALTRLLDLYDDEAQREEVLALMER